MPRDGGDAAAVLQERAVCDPQSAERVAEPEPAADLRGVLSHGQQCGPPEGPQVVVKQSRREHGDGVACVCGKYIVVD